MSVPFSHQLPDDSEIPSYCLKISRDIFTRISLPKKPINSLHIEEFTNNGLTNGYYSVSTCGYLIFIKNTQHLNNLANIDDNIPIEIKEIMSSFSILFFNLVSGLFLKEISEIVHKVISEFVFDIDSVIYIDDVSFIILTSSGTLYRVCQSRSFIGENKEQENKYLIEDGNKINPIFTFDLDSLHILKYNLSLINMDVGTTFIYSALSLNSVNNSLLYRLGSLNDFHSFLLHLPYGDESIYSLLLPKSNFSLYEKYYLFSSGKLLSNISNPFDIHKSNDLIFLQSTSKVLNSFKIENDNSMVKFDSILKTYLPVDFQVNSIYKIFSVNEDFIHFIYLGDSRNYESIFYFIKYKYIFKHLKGSVDKDIDKNKDCNNFNNLYSIYFPQFFNSIFRDIDVFIFNDIVIFFTGESPIIIDLSIIFNRNLLWLGGYHYSQNNIMSDNLSKNVFYSRVFGNMSVGRILIDLFNIDFSLYHFVQDNDENDVIESRDVKDGKNQEKINDNGKNAEKIKDDEKNQDTITDDEKNECKNKDNGKNECKNKDDEKNVDKINDELVEDSEIQNAFIKNVIYSEDIDSDNPIISSAQEAISLEIQSNKELLSMDFMKASLKLPGAEEIIKKSQEKREHLKMGLESEKFNFTISEQIALALNAMTSQFAINNDEYINSAIGLEKLTSIFLKNNEIFINFQKVILSLSLNEFLYNVETCQLFLSLIVYVQQFIHFHNFTGNRQVDMSNIHLQFYMDIIDFLLFIYQSDIFLSVPQFNVVHFYLSICQLNSIDHDEIFNNFKNSIYDILDELPHIKSLDKNIKKSSYMEEILYLPEKTSITHLHLYCRLLLQHVYKILYHFNSMFQEDLKYIQFFYKILSKLFYICVINNQSVSVPIIKIYEILNLKISVNFSQIKRVNIFAKIFDWELLDNKLLNALNSIESRMTNLPSSIQNHHSIPIHIKINYATDYLQFTDFLEICSMNDFDKISNKIEKLLQTLIEFGNNSDILTILYHQLIKVLFGLVNFKYEILESVLYYSVILNYAWRSNHNISNSPFTCSPWLGVLLSETNGVYQNPWKRSIEKYPLKSSLIYILRTIEVIFKVPFYFQHENANALLNMKYNAIGRKLDDQNTTSINVYIDDYIELLNLMTQNKTVMNKTVTSTMSEYMSDLMSMSYLGQQQKLQQDRINQKTAQTSLDLLNEIKSVVNICRRHGVIIDYNKCSSLYSICEYIEDSNILTKEQKHELFSNIFSFCHISKKNAVFNKFL